MALSHVVSQHDHQGIVVPNRFVFRLWMVCHGSEVLELQETAHRCEEIYGELWDVFSQHEVANAVLFDSEV